MELVNTDFQCNGRQPLGAPSPSMALGSLAFGFGIRPSSGVGQNIKDKKKDKRVRD